MTHNLKDKEGDLEKIGYKIDLLKKKADENFGIINSHKNLIKLIEKYGENYDRLEKRLKNGDESIKSLIEESKKSLEVTKGIIADAITNTDEIKTKVQEIELKKIEIEKKHEEYLKLCNEANDLSNGITSTLTEAHKDRTNIEKLTISANELLTQIQNLLSQSQQKISDINDVYDQLITVKGKIDDPSKGLEFILSSSKQFRDDINAIKEQGNTIFTEISRIKDDSNTFLNEIEDNRNNSKEKFENIQNYEKDSNEYKEKIEKIYKLAIDSNLANSFDIRKHELNKSSIIWGSITIFSIIVLSLILYDIQKTLFQSGKIDLNNVTWYKLIFTLPLVYFIPFSTKQYTNERTYLEKYSFKSAVAFALESHTTLLVQKFPDERPKIMKFVLGRLRMINKEPYDLKNQSKLSLSVGNNIAAIKAEMIDTATNIKTIKKSVEPIKDIVQLTKDKVLNN